jgi:PIN domain nuclease of toxin-antitoxin system
VNLLLDTHVLLWWCADSRRLGAVGRSVISRADAVYVSAASAWEVSIKLALGRLRLQDPFATLVAQSGFEELPVTFQHAEHVLSLPPHHSDPFDRMLLAQAQVEALTFVTHDRQLQPYPVSFAWV